MFVRLPIKVLQALIRLQKRYFAAYEVTKKALTPAGASPSELNLGAVILAGGTAGIAMWALAIPPDVGFERYCCLLTRS